jgi:hypothetical protein
MSLVIVRIPKKIVKKWLSRHEKDGLDEYKISISERLLLFTMNFQKRGGQPHEG